MAEVFNLPEIVKKEVKALIKSGYYDSVDEVASDAFRTLLNVKPDLKMTAAIELYKEGRISLNKAAEMVGVSTIEFKDILSNRGIVRKIGSRNKEELEKGVKFIKKLRGC